MRKLVVPVERHLERNSEGLDSHDGHGSGRRTDGKVNERILLAMSGRDLVDHDDREDGHDGAVEHETYGKTSVGFLVFAPK
jgi:hypothetical protein